MGCPDRREDLRSVRGCARGAGAEDGGWLSQQEQQPHYPSTLTSHTTTGRKFKLDQTGEQTRPRSTEGWLVPGPWTGGGGVTGHPPLQGAHPGPQGAVRTLLGETPGGPRRGVHWSQCRASGPLGAAVCSLSWGLEAVVRGQLGGHCCEPGWVSVSAWSSLIGGRSRAGWTHHPGLGLHSRSGPQSTWECPGGRSRGLSSGPSPRVRTGGSAGSRPRGERQRNGVVPLEAAPSGPPSVKGRTRPSGPTRT